jgi:CrcB protein
VRHSSQIYLIDYILIAFAGACGVSLRFACDYMFKLTSQQLWPYSTLLCNLIGSFLLGWFMYDFAQRTTQRVKLLIATGFLGSFTTFSTVALEWLVFYIDKQFIDAMLYLIVTIFGGLLFAWIGFWVASWRQGRSGH